MMPDVLLPDSTARDDAMVLLVDDRDENLEVLEALLERPA